MPDINISSTDMKTWYVYMLKCADDTLYTGITTDIERRLAEHNGEYKGKGAAYTTARRPVSLFYYEQADNRSMASKREAQIKKLPREEKLNMPVRSN